MTFIASIVAKKGVALIADSLVTSITRVIEYENFIGYIKDKYQNSPVEELKIEPVDMVNLFQRKPSHTKDYEEKLFMYDKYIGVTTAGSAEINNKRIEYLIKEIVEANKKNKNYNRKRFDTKIKEFCDFINKQAIEHLNIYEEISNTNFIFTHYDKGKEKTEIVKIEVLSCNKTDIHDETFNCIKSKKMEEYLKVVCDGQNRISERIIFGEIDFFIDITPKIIKKVLADLKIDPLILPEDYEKTFLMEAKSFLPKEFFDDMKINKLAGLSLQQAVDLASLLMKVEINFQKYTENIPTVGGVIKLAIIDKDGFRFISGNNILKPENLH
ncbi:MAG: hypothetical protein CFE21_08725 [Bacteroidetes bacterium B1(2017)]|nr:MAG: hypothetical protein CFE21_08725 [Bacteroidetes bacterium B1(2017)]